MSHSHGNKDVSSVTKGDLPKSFSIASYNSVFISCMPLNN